MKVLFCNCYLSGMRKDGRHSQSLSNSQEGSSHTTPIRVIRIYDQEQGSPSSKMEGSQESNVYTLFHMKLKHDETLTVNVNASGAKLIMEVDAGAAVFVISEQTNKHSWPSGSRPLLQNTSLQLW